MQWLNSLVDEVVTRKPKGDILISSGVSPSGTYHLGTLREVLTAEVILRELKRRGRKAKHLHVVDDLDVFRKVPVDVPEEFKKYLGKPLCDVPAPDGSKRSYADFFLADLIEASKGLHLEMEIIRAHQKYRSGFLVSAIEKALTHTEQIKQILEKVSGRKLEENWSPVQVIEEGYLKNRKFLAINTDTKQLRYEDVDGNPQSVSYEHGEVKLNWRIDWPARWWLLGIDVEPFGRDHATKGGSYDTGEVLAKDIFGISPPIPVPYHFINKTGDTKKMSKSAGDTITASQLLTILPAELVWFFVIRYAPDKQLFFDQGPTLMRLFDEFGELLAKPNKTDQEQQLVDLCMQGVDKPTVSRVPFSHLVASYQAALKDQQKTLEVIARTEHAKIVEEDKETILEELYFIDAWLKHGAPEDVKFELADKVDASQFSQQQKSYLKTLTEKIAQAPEDADGEWFHKSVYELETNLEPKEKFVTLYQAIIGKNSGPRAGWFLSTLPRDWLIKRLNLEG